MAQKRPSVGADSNPPIAEQLKAQPPSNVESEKASEVEKSGTAGGCVQDLESHNSIKEEMCKEACSEKLPFNVCNSC